MNPKSDAKRSPSKTVAEFFAGIGLMRLGLEQAGWTTVFANDLDPDKERMYRANFDDADSHFVLEDIHKLSSADIPRVSLATASFPCNDLSLAGARGGLAGKNSSAFWGFTRILREMGSRAPSMILLENVTGFFTSNGGRDFQQVMLALNELGYAVDPLILDAAWFVPQSRQRLFVVGTKTRSLDSLAVEERFFESPVRPAVLADFIFAHPEITWNIRELPHPPTGTRNLTEILEDLPATSTAWWSAERATYLLNQMSPRHRGIAEGMIASPTYSYGTIFRRVRHGKSMAELRTDGRAGCLRTPRGGSGRQILFKAGKGSYHVRLLTGRECARLMGADNFALNVSLNQALFGFGDAVCVPVIEWIARNYLNPVFEEIHPPVTGGPTRALSSAQ